MKVHFEKENETKTLSFSGKVKDLLEQLQINPETVVVVKEGAIVTEDEMLADNDEITLLSVISGG